MKTLLYRCKILVSILSISIVVYLTLFYSYKTITNITIGHNINVENIDNIRSNLDLVFSEISNKTNADIVWINIFHNKPNKEFTIGSTPSEDILLTALHHWIRPNYKISIKLARNQPITELPQIEETLAGKCIGRINSSSNPYELSEVPIDRLVLRCPLYDKENNLIGIFGMSYFGFKNTNKDQFVKEHSAILLSYKDTILDLVFE